MTELTVYEQRALDWFNALYGTKYEQCEGGLHKVDDGYCCLGVAADVSKLGFWAESNDDSDGDMLCNWVALEHQEKVKKYNLKDLIDDDDIALESSVMPGPVMEYYGVKSSHGIFDWFSLPVNLRWQILQELMNPKVVLNDVQRRALLDPGYNDGATIAATHSLVFLNDKGVSFWLIAEVIKARPKRLFTWTP